MNETLRKRLLIIKNDIEKMIAKPKEPLATIYSIIDCFNGLFNRQKYETITEKVKDFYERYNFVYVREKGIGWEVIL